MSFLEMLKELLCNDIEIDDFYLFEAENLRIWDKIDHISPKNIQLHKNGEGVLDTLKDI